MPVTHEWKLLESACFSVVEQCFAMQVNKLLNVGGKMNFVDKQSHSRDSSNDSEVIPASSTKTHKRKCGKFTAISKPPIYIVGFYGYD